MYPTTHLIFDWQSAHPNARKEFHTDKGRPVTGGGGSGSGKGDDYGVVLIGLQTGGDDPGVAFALNRLNRCVGQQ
jgi:hypothetical protein